MLTVGVCEDDAALRSVLARSLRAEGHTVIVTRNGHEAVRDFPAANPDVIVLDIGLPDADGRDVCLALRAAGLDSRILFLTARDRTTDKLEGFKSGGDDYLTKPFELDELFARTAALGRRRNAEPRAQPELHLDPLTHAIRHRNMTVALTPTEFRLVAALISSPGHVVRRRALVVAGWPSGATVHDNTLDSYIRRVREKLMRLTEVSQSIDTIRGVGYVWR